MRTTALAPLALLLGASCIDPWTEEEETPDFVPRAAFVYPDTSGDHGWTKTHEEARLYLEEELGIETTRQELVATADLGSVIDAFQSEGWNFYVTTASTYISGTQQAAMDYPDSYFLSVSGTVSGPNLRSFYGRMYQPIYVAGFLAAQMSCTGHLGVVAKFPIPRQISHIDAFTLGARRANPDAVVDVRYLNDTSDAATETAYTLELVAAGADVILTQTNTTVPVETAVDAFVTCDVEGTPVQSEVYSIGFNNPNACENGPERCLTSAYWSWGPLYEQAITSISDGTWAELDVTMAPMTDESDSVVNLAEISTIVPGAVRTEVDALRVAVVDGSLAAPFVGPLTDNGGALRVDAGAEMTDEEIGRLCWYVDGVVSSASGELVPATVPSSCVGDH